MLRRQLQFSTWAAASNLAWLLIRLMFSTLSTVSIVSKWGMQITLPSLLCACPPAITHLLDNNQQKRYCCCFEASSVFTTRQMAESTTHFAATLSMYKLISSLFQALLKSAVSGIGHRIHTTENMPELVFTQTHHEYMADIIICL